MFDKGQGTVDRRRRVQGEISGPRRGRGKKKENKGGWTVREGGNLEGGGGVLVCCLAYPFDHAPRIPSETEHCSYSNVRSLRCFNILHRKGLLSYPLPVSPPVATGGRGGRRHTSSQTTCAHTCTHPNVDMRTHTHAHACASACASAYTHIRDARLGPQTDLDSVGGGEGDRAINAARQKPRQTNGGGGDFS